ncbi:MAG: hypothetical protein ACETWE_06405 [Candidatus Bathyarchaeia archaeon]
MFILGTRTILSLIIISLGFGIFAVGVYTFHYFYQPVFTMLCAGMGALLIDLGIMVLCELEAKIRAFLKIGLKKTENLSGKRGMKAPP